MRDSLEHSKRKLQENAELMQVNTLFKKLKQHFDDLKGMLGDLHDHQTLKRDFFQVERDLGEREIRGQTQEYRMRLAFARGCEQQTLLYKKAREDIDKEAAKVQGEIGKVEEDVCVIQNEHQALLTKLENIRRESRLVEEHMATTREYEGHQESMMSTVEARLAEERVRQEELEVQMYEQSVKMATLSEDTEKVLAFMEEFIKRQIGGASQKPRDNTMYRELSESDKESVNELLKSLGVQYKEVF